MEERSSQTEQISIFLRGSVVKVVKGDIAWERHSPSPPTELLRTCTTIWEVMTSLGLEKPEDLPRAPDYTWPCPGANLSDG